MAKKIQKKFKKEKLELKDPDAISIYFKEINSIPLLTREKEVEYAKKAQEGDETARKKLIEANLRFVISVAKKYQNRGLPLSDLISEGNIGLMNAIEKYDVNKGYHFITYAQQWIRQAILKAIPEQSRTIRVPLDVHFLLPKIERILSNEEYNIENPFSDEGINQIYEIIKNDLGIKTKITKHSIRRSLQYNGDAISLDNPLYNDGEDFATIADTFPDKSNLEDLCTNHLLDEEISDLLKTIPEREENIIRYYFGVNEKNIKKTLKQLGDEYKITSERVRQLREKGIKRLRTQDNWEYFSSYFDDEN